MLTFTLNKSEEVAEQMYELTIQYGVKNAGEYIVDRNANDRGVLNSEEFLYEDRWIKKTVSSKDRKGSTNSRFTDEELESEWKMWEVIRLGLIKTFVEDFQEFVTDDVSTNEYLLEFLEFREINKYMDAWEVIKRYVSSKVNEDGTLKEGLLGGSRFYASKRGDVVNAIKVLDNFFDKYENVNECLTQELVEMFIRKIDEVHTQSKIQPE